MKKSLSIILVLLIIATAFAGCNSGNDSERLKGLINTAFEKNGALNDLDLTSVTAMQYDYGTSAYSIESTSELKVHNIKSFDKYEMSEDVTTYSSVSANATKYDVYYKDGYFYTTRYGGAFKSRLSAEEAGVANAGSIINMQYDDMRSVGFKTGGDDDGDSSDAIWGKGYTAITFTCKNSAIKEYMNLAADDTDSKYESVSINKGEGEYIINAEGYLVYEELTVSATVTMDGEEMSSHVSTQITYNNIGKEVDPYDPEDSEFTEVKELEDVIGINSAMSKTLSSSDYQMEMTAKADITQADTVAGYDRTFIRSQDLSGSEYLQKTLTTYRSGNEEGSTVESSQYYTNGRYYQYSDLYSQKIYCVMDFSTFVGGIYAQAATSPADAYTTGMMKDISSKKTDDGTVYSFNLNATSDDGLTFLGSIVGPYENFSGDFSTAEITVNSFSGKIYVDNDGYYYKTEVVCDALVKFEEGDVEMKFQQTITMDEIDGNVNCEFPDFSKVEYERMEQSELLGAFSGSSTSSTDSE